MNSGFVPRSRLREAQCRRTLVGSILGHHLRRQRQARRATAVPAAKQEAVLPPPLGAPRRPHVRMPTFAYAPVRQVKGPEHPLHDLLRRRNRSTCRAKTSCLRKTNPAPFLAILGPKSGSRSFRQAPAGCGQRPRRWLPLPGRRRARRSADAGGAAAPFVCASTLYRATRALVSKISF
jgi:hypothetical protein